MNPLKHLRDWFFPPLDPDDGCAILERLQVDPVFRSWAYAHCRGSLMEIWHRCPRPDWLIDLSVRAGLRPKLVGEGVEAFAAVAEAGRAGASLELAETRRATQAWVEGTGSAESLGCAVTALLNLVYDADQTVRGAEDARRQAIGRDFPVEHVNAALTEQSALTRLAEAVRTRLRYGEVHFCIFKKPVGESPYR